MGGWHGVCLLLGAMACGGPSVVADAPVADTSIIDDAAIDAPPPSRRRGTVAAARHAFPNRALQLVAGFVRAPDGVPGCASTVVSACSLVVCPEDAGVIAVSAGDITFSADSQTHVSVPSTSASYVQGSLPDISPGTFVSISAAGGEIPAFSILGIAVPVALTRTAPPDEATFDRTQDLVVSWTAAQGTAYLSIAQSPFTSPYPLSYRTSVSCEFQATNGSGTVPAALLGAFAPGPVVASLSALEGEIRDVGGYEVRLAVGHASQPWTSFTAQ